MKVVSKGNRSTLKAKRSEFIATIGKADSVEEAKKFISEISKEFRDATHNCWAYRVFEGGRILEHMSDAGEPSGSAGPPILNALRKFDLVNVVSVVTRYFGGVKLGIKGLREAYHAAVLKTIEGVELLDADVFKVYKIFVKYSDMGKILSDIEKKGGRILGMEHLQDGVELIYAVPGEGVGGSLLRKEIMVKR